MGCDVCSSDVGGTPAGCKSNGGCSTGGCNKLNSFDWLGNMDLPGIDPFEIVEVRFKGGRKAFYRNVNRLFLSSGDAIVVEAQTGHHVGFIAIQGELVRLQMRKKKVKEEDELPIIYRKATERDLERLAETKKRELPTMYRTREIVKQLELTMKLSDVEYQADNTKATFFYSADERVDFRELIKILAGEFKIRVEMRQISLRQEASRIGGIGSCGRELCCSTWLTDFQSVSTGAARYQNLSLNPNKLSGQCGRLKCCLNYELETYQDALLDIPKVDKPLQTERGEASLQKVDIFRKQLWFSFENDSNWYPVEAERVKQIIELNSRGIKAETLDGHVVTKVEKPSRASLSGRSRGGNTTTGGNSGRSTTGNRRGKGGKPKAERETHENVVNKPAAKGKQGKGGQQKPKGKQERTAGGSKSNPRRKNRQNVQKTGEDQQSNPQQKKTISGNNPANKPNNRKPKDGTNPKQVKKNKGPKKQAPNQSNPPVDKANTPEKAGNADKPKKPRRWRGNRKKNPPKKQDD